jgi:hypothetical protein
VSCSAADKLSEPGSPAITSVQPREYCKTILSAISCTVLSGIVALLLAYWPASAGGDVLAKLNIVRAELTAQIPDRTHKTDRLPQVSFEQRWSAVPGQSNPIRSDSGQSKQPQAERRIEKIPFSCELAFSRLVSKGNFSTRCIFCVVTSLTGIRSRRRPIIRILNSASSTNTE